MINFISDPDDVARLVEPEVAASVIVRVLGVNVSADDPAPLQFVGFHLVGATGIVYGECPLSALDSIVPPRAVVLRGGAAEGDIAFCGIPENEASLILFTGEEGQPRRFFALE